ncbi:TBCC domain-containing protein 1-like [Saccoglossus kowalevskii]|uniref:TBCC domain-containing protein 1 n=1 Tax=Saccoglossus kowalevskii TaxID=10224 RepID=A0ABM0GT67_SACKO|nr:PREDICTED: TBCC domain-containing protein 1-like [Saccoglossus kowalevskii]
MATFSMSVSLWVKPEPFNFGALQIPPHPKLSMHYLKKIAVYAKTKGKGGFPRLTYPTWKRIACSKMGLPEEEAWLYFEGFDLLDRCPPEQRLQIAELFTDCKTPEDTEQVKNSLSVNTCEFLLYLFLQQVYKISLRTSLVSTGEEWPMRARSPDIEGRSSGVGAKSMDENAHLMFILNNLNAILQLLVEADCFVGANSSENRLSITAVEALGFIIAASTDKKRSMRPLLEVALMQPFQQKSGFSKISQTFSLRTFESWLRANLGSNPFGLSVCISAGRRLSWPATGSDYKEDSGQKRGRIATNAQFAPKECKIIILSQVGKQTLAKCSKTLEGAAVKIHRCHYAYIYLLSPLRSVSIEKCRHSTIVLGSVESTVHVNACEHLTLITTCRRLSVNASTLCTFHALTSTRPLILGGNDSIILAPYHTHYSLLEEHMAKSGIAVTPNMWDKPMCLGPEHRQASPVWSLMLPRDFFTFVIPFSIEGLTSEIPGGLPSKYERGLTQREKNIKTWQKTVKESGLSEQQRKQFQSVVEAKFQAWLDDSGHRRQLDGLATPSK